MIVRNESEVIVRCLEAVKPYVDSFAIVDTGSDDDTIQKTLETMKGVPGEVIERPWEGMSKSRNAALERARKRGCDYILMLDADDVWTPEEGFAWPDLTEDAYEVTFKMGTTTWVRPALMRSDAPWRYVGVAHEHLEGGALVNSRITGAFIDARPDGHRRKTEGKAKYNRIAAILEEDLAKNPENNRNMFYLAQSYRDAERYEEAIIWYRKRINGRGWAEEVWYSYFQIAVLMARLEYPVEDVCKAFEAAYEDRPARAEPMAEGARYARQHWRAARGFMYAAAAVDLPPTQDKLFVDEGVAWRALDEMAVCAHKIGRLDVAIETNMRLLQREDLPDAARARIESNLQAAAKAGQYALDQVG
jgi:glycosyltransferase involved in cell wall biosynthesis